MAPSSCYCHRHAHPARGPRPWPAPAPCPGLALLRGSPSSWVPGCSLSTAKAWQVVIHFLFSSSWATAGGGGSDYIEGSCITPRLTGPLPCPSHAPRTLFRGPGFLSLVSQPVPLETHGEVGQEQAGPSHWGTTWVMALARSGPCAKSLCDPGQIRLFWASVSQAVKGELGCKSSHY